MNRRRPSVAPRPTSPRLSRTRRDKRMGIPLIAVAIALLGGLIGAYGFLAEAELASAWKPDARPRVLPR